MQPPLFILTLPRSFSTVTAMMLGRHPQMYGVPELNLFLVETMDQWLRFTTRVPFQMHDGLLRTVAELYFGGQTTESIHQAQEWIQQRSGKTVVEVFREIAANVDPLILVDKSPATAMMSRSMTRALHGLPNAKFLYLTRHPRGYCESIIRIMQEHERESGVYRGYRPLAAHPPPRTQETEQPPTGNELDPQHGWVHFNHGILRFLEAVPKDRQMHVRGEDLLARPDTMLERIAEWMGIHSDPAAIEEMKHPERSPFANVGPPEARAGGDPTFLKRPTLRTATVAEPRLSGPLSWRVDGADFSPEAQKLAGHLGYK